MTIYGNTLKILWLLQIYCGFLNNTHTHTQNRLLWFKWWLWPQKKPRVCFCWLVLWKCLSKGLNISNWPPLKHLANPTATCQYCCAWDTVHKSYITISKIDRALPDHTHKRQIQFIGFTFHTANTNVWLVPTCSSTHYSYDLLTRKQRYFATGSLHSEQKDGQHV